VIDPLPTLKTALDTLPRGASGDAAFAFGAGADEQRGVVTRLVNKPWGYVLAVPLTTYTRAADNATFDAALMLVMGVLLSFVIGNTVERTHILPLSERARLAAAKVMDNKKATEFARALAQQGRPVETKVANDHRLASDAAAKLFASGRLRQAETAYRELVSKHGDVDSYGGLARTLISLEDRDGALVALREGAAAFARKNDRVNAIALLGIAVEIAPFDLAAHRRFAAALANQGDLISACQEYARFIDTALSQRDTRRSRLVLTYGTVTLGDLPQLLAIADRVAAAQGGAMPTPPPPVRAAATPSTIPVPRPATSASASWTPPAKPATPDPRPAPISTKPSPAAANGRPTIIGASEVLAKPAPSALGNLMQARTRPEASNAVVIKDARTMTHAER